MVKKLKRKVWTDVDTEVFGAMTRDYDTLKNWLSQRADSEFEVEELDPYITTFTVIKNEAYTRFHMVRALDEYWFIFNTSGDKAIRFHNTEDVKNMIVYTLDLIEISQS